MADKSEEKGRNEDGLSSELIGEGSPHGSKEELHEGVSCPYQGNGSGRGSKVLCEEGLCWND